MTDWSMQNQKLVQPGTLVRLRKLVVALIVAPALLGLALGTGAALTVLVAMDMGLPRLAIAAESAGPALIALYGFAALFGLPGILGLWAVRAQDCASWCWTGGLLGIVAGAGFEVIVLDRVELVVPVLCGLAGCMLFLVMRWVSGVQDRRFYH